MNSSKGIQLEALVNQNAPADSVLVNLWKQQGSKQRRNLPCFACAATCKRFSACLEGIHRSKGFPSNTLLLQRHEVRPSDLELRLMGG